MYYPDPDDLDSIDAAAETAYRRRLQARKDFQRSCVEARVGDDSDPDAEWDEHEDEVAREARG